MKHIHDVDSSDSLRTLIIQDLKERGIKIPKQKSKENVNKENECVVFGSALQSIPANYVDDCGYVPKFLLEALEIIGNHLDCEGLFRKTGSVARQKELKKRICEGESLDDAQVFDLTSLVKQFFRELPDPLLTSRLHGAFIQAYQLEDEDARLSTILSLCLLLPWDHLSTLRYTMQFLHKVAARSTENKMDATNLAVVMTPNLMNINNRSEKMSSTEGKLIQVQTLVVETLIVYADRIGLVSDILDEKSSLMASCFTSEDELDRGMDAGEDKPKKKKRRSGSLQGLISGINQSISKWRGNAGHNTSKTINDSVSTVDCSTLSDQTDGGFVSTQDLPVNYLEATPKLMRKRKADEDMVPFSATKKKAILQQMPAMSALGSTPFTPASVLKQRKAQQQDFTIGTPNIQFSEDNYVVFTAYGRDQQRNLNTPFVKAQLLPAYKPKPQTTNKAGCFSPKSAAVVTPGGGKKKSVKGFLRRLSGGKDQPNPANGTRDSPDVALRLSFTEEDTAIYADSDTPNKKKWGLFRKHKKTPSSPARLIVGGLNMSHASQQSVLTNDSAFIDDAMDSRPASRSGDAFVVELHDKKVDNRDKTSNSISDLALAKQLGRDLGDGSLRVPRVPHKRAFSADSSHNASTALKRGKPNTLGSGLPMTKQRKSIDPSELDSRALSLVLSAECETSEHEQVPSPVMMSDEQPTPSDEADTFSICTSQSSLNTALIDTSYCDETTDARGDDNGDQNNASDDSKAQSSKSGLFKCSTGSTLNISPDQSMRSEVVSAEEVTIALDPLDGSTCSRLSSNASQVTVIDMKQHDPCSSSSVERSDSNEHKSNTAASQNVEKSTSKVDAVHRSKSFHGQNKPVLMDINEASQLTRRSSVRESCPGLVDLRKRRPLHQGLGEPTLSISSETHSILSRAGVVGKKSKYSKGAYVAVPKPSEERPSDSEITKTVHESVVELKSSNAGGVAKNVNKFNDMSTHGKELTEKHTSPYRFPRSSLRNRGTSPVRIPSIFAKGDKEAAKFRDMVMTSDLVQHHHKSPASRNASRGKPCLPITTTMVRHPCVEQAISQYQQSVRLTTDAGRSEQHYVSSPEDSRKDQIATLNEDDTSKGVQNQTDTSSNRAISVDESVPELPEDMMCTPKPDRVFRNANVEALKNFTKRLSGSPEVSQKMTSLQLTTPKIKPAIMSSDLTRSLLHKPPGQPLLPRMPASLTGQTPSRCRSPVKPLKRLKGSPGSPRSPRKYPTSPMKPLKLNRKQGLSPIPAHIKEFSL